MRIHCLENVDKSLTFLGEKAVKLENMGAHDIVDGNSRLTLGLIWTIILRFQVQYLNSKLTLVSIPAYESHPEINIFSDTLCHSKHD